MATKKIILLDHLSTFKDNMVGKKYNDNSGEIFNSYNRNIASGAYSHAEGLGNKASETASHVEGSGSEASGYYSHAEGGFTIAEGECSHAEGESTRALGAFSHAEGCATTASSDYQHVQGKYNVEDTESKYADIIGGGSSNSSRKNIETTSVTGTKWLAEDVKIGGWGEDDEEAISVKNSLSSKINSSSIVQTTGTSETSIMSQKAVTEALANTGGGVTVVQTTGNSTTSVMSQQAVTIALTNALIGILSYQEIV